MSDEKKNKKRILFIIIPVVLILIGLGAAGCFLFPKISAKLFPDSALSGETLADDTASASSDSAPDAAPGTDANTQKTSAEQTTGTLPETSTPESAVPTTGDAGTSAPDETDPGTDAQTTSEADTSAHVTTNPETTGAPETSGSETADTPETRHIHTLGAWTVIRQATCTEEGLKECKCTACGETLTETIAVLFHNYGAWTATRQASCDVDGEQTRTCTKCGHKETKAIPAAGHKWDSGKASSTTGCGAGIKTYTCTVCGKTKTEQVSGGNHTWGEWQWEEYTFDYTDKWGFFYPDSTGRKKFHTCTKCGYKEYANIPQHQCDVSFKQVNVSVPKKCGDRNTGYSLNYCSVCGFEYGRYQEWDFVQEHLQNAGTTIKKTVEYHSEYSQTSNEITAYFKECFCNACGKKMYDEHFADEERKTAFDYELGVHNMPCYFELLPGYRNEVFVLSFTDSSGFANTAPSINRYERAPVARNLQVGTYNGQKCIVGFTAYWKNFNDGKVYSEYVDCTLPLKEQVRKYLADDIDYVKANIPDFDFDAWWDRTAYYPSVGSFSEMLAAIITSGSRYLEFGLTGEYSDHLVFSGCRSSGSPHSGTG